MKMMNENNIQSFYLGKKVYSWD